jgi:hypothetical protein
MTTRTTYSVCKHGRNYERLAAPRRRTPLYTVPESGSVERCGFKLDEIEDRAPRLGYRRCSNPSPPAAFKGRLLTPLHSGPCVR